MAKIVYSPILELIVHDTLEVDLDDLLRERITPSGIMPIYWCDGMAFSFSSVPMSDEVVKEYLKGTLHWAEVHYAKMNSYTPIAELNDPHFQTAMKIRVIDTSKSQLHADFIRWLKKTRK